MLFHCLCQIEFQYACCCRFDSKSSQLLCMCRNSQWLPLSCFLVNVMEGTVKSISVLRQTVCKVK